MSIVWETAGGIARIQLARPEKKNAITVAMYEAMGAAVLSAQEDGAVRAIVIQGQPEVFTAGNDLQDFMQGPSGGMDSPVFRFMRAMIECDKPVIAAVNGAAVGIGTTMLLHCDLVYCSENARFSMPFVSLGLCPEFASSLLLPAMSGYHAAAEKILLGEAFDAAEALRMGIVNRVLPAGEVDDFAMAQADRFNGLPPNAVRTSKRLLRQGHAKGLEQRIAEEGAHFGQLMQSAEAREAFTAFFQKRKPDFSKFS